MAPAAVPPGPSITSRIAKESQEYSGTLLLWHREVEKPPDLSPHAQTRARGRTVVIPQSDEGRFRKQNTIKT